MYNKNKCVWSPRQGSTPGFGSDLQDFNPIISYNLEPNLAIQGVPNVSLVTNCLFAPDFELLFRFVRRSKATRFASVALPRLLTFSQVLHYSFSKIYVSSM